MCCFKILFHVPLFLKLSPCPSKGLRTVLVGLSKHKCLVEMYVEMFCKTLKKIRVQIVLKAKQKMQPKHAKIPI